MFKIAVCDDEERICDSIDQILFDYSQENKIKLDVDLYFDGESLCDALRAGEIFHLIFLDIEMGTISGIDIGKELRVNLKNYNTELVYVSGKPEYSRELLAMRPLDFIDKPICVNEVIRLLELAMSLFSEESGFFHFPNNGQTERVTYNKILYFEKALRKVEIHTNDTILEFYAKFIDFSEDLPGHFVQISRSFLVNLRRIHSYGSKSITMDNGVVISIGDQFRESFVKAQQMELAKRGMIE